MSNDLRLYVGLPGSGKSYHAFKECDVVVDDIKDLSEMPFAISVRNETLGVTDVNFCDSIILDRAKKVLSDLYPNKTLVVIYFENDPDKCRENVKHRDDGRNVEGTINRFAPIYTPPETARKIWSPEYEF